MYFKFKKKYYNLYKFKKYFKKYKKIIIILIIVMVLASSLGLTLPFFYGKRLIGITDYSFKNVLKFSIIIVLIVTFHHLFWYFWEKLASILTNKVSNDIRIDLFDKILNTKYYDLKNKTIGYFLERISDDTFEVSSFLSNLLGTAVDTITNFSFLIAILILNFKFGILFIFGIIILYIIDLYKINIDLKYTKILKELNETLNSKVNEYISGIISIKGLGIKREVFNSIVFLTTKISSLQIEKDNMYAILSRAKTYFQYCIESLLIVYSVGVLIPKGNMSILILLMILDYTGFMYDLVQYIANFKNHLVKGEYKANRLLEILDNKNIEEFGDINILDSFNIKVNNLTYYYEDNKKELILNNVSFEIKENTINLFIGKSGSGKSTLFGLIAKILNINDNNIFVGNIDINKISEKKLKKELCLINQDPFLINDSILNNIKIVKPTATKKEIIYACKKANIYDDIINFNHKFNTIVLENGNNLSGGQKQRIQLARAILKESKILLFDEPTSSLDKYNQKIFLDTISSLKNYKTILIIAHKFNNKELFDNIFELKNGTLKKINK